MASTGDLWLFRGPAVAAWTIRAATNSPVNHVGMVVALDDLPPLLWHAELGRSLPDVWTGERQRGVQLHRLEDAVRTWGGRYGQRAWLRQLEGTVDRGHEDRLMEVIARFDGRAFPTTPGRARPGPGGGGAGAPPPPRGGGVPAAPGPPPPVADRPLPPPRGAAGDRLLRRA